MYRLDTIKRLRYRLMVGQRTLTPLIVVRIHVAQPKLIKAP